MDSLAGQVLAPEFVLKYHWHHNYKNYFNKKSRGNLLLHAGDISYRPCRLVWYGLRKNDLPIVFTNAFAVLVNLSTNVFSIKYKNKNGYS